MRDSAPSTVRDLQYSLQYEKWHSLAPEHISAQVSRLTGLFGHLLPPANHTPVIDIGCGMGFAMQMLIARGFTDVTGVDIDSGQVEACLSQGLRVELIEDLGEYLLPREEQFGLAMMIDVLEHLPWTLQLSTLRALYRSLKPGGLLILSVPNATSPIAVRWLYNDYTHFNTFTEISIDFVLRNAGFCPITIEGSDPSLSLRAALAPATLAKLSTSKAGRQRLKLAFTRWLWKQILEAELGEGALRVPLGRNLHVLAKKP